MSPVLVVCRKEILDNARDRRTIFSTLLFGPLFAPVMFAVMINMMVGRAVSTAEEELAIPILGPERAPNVVAFLAANGITGAELAGVATLEDGAEAVRARRAEVVVVIDPEFGADLAAEAGARITVVFDRSDTRASGRARRVQGALRAYSEQIGALRLLARGMRPDLVRPLVIDEYDVSTPAGRSALVLGVLTYFLLFATLLGGLYLATDTTAGERERKSLEPLLTLPVTRASLLAGKVAATICFMLLSLALTLMGFVAVLTFLPLEQLGMSAHFGIATALGAFAIVAPMAPLGATLLTLVASFTKSYKEAQTYLGLLLLVPTLPVIGATLLNVKATHALMWVPSMSQHLLVTALIKNEPLAAGMVAESVTSTLLIGALLGWITRKLYEREGLLG
ncbi:MAG TPA: ABC transporter permease [Gammaproteobacteria bacterium]|jgi:sodium transport system permease protein